MLREHSVETHFFTWPPVVIGHNKINPLYDARVTKVLFQRDVEHCCVTPRLIGREGEKEHKLKDPRGIATNSSGEFIIGDCGGYVKVFDRNGKFVKHFSLPINTLSDVLDVATDTNDNIFVLTALESLWLSYMVYKLIKTADLHHKFRLRGGSSSYQRLSGSDTGKVVTLSCGKTVEEYDSNGTFVRSFGEEILKSAKDITVANDGCVLVLDIDEDSFLNIFDKEDFSVHIFSEHGDYLNQFKVQRNYFYYTSITFHPAGEHVVVAGKEPDRNLLEVKIYSKDGKFVRSVQIQHVFSQVTGITLNNDGRIVVVASQYKNSKVVVL